MITLFNKMTNSTDLYCLEVHNEKTLKWKRLLAIVLFSIAGISIIIQLFFNKFWASFRPLYLNAVWILGLVVYGIVHWSKSVFELNKVVLRIDKDGIWTPKYGLWQWPDIWYFNTIDENVGRGERINFLEVKLREGINDGKDYLLFSLDDYDVHKEQIRAAFEKYAALYGINDLGHKVKG